MKLYLIHPVGYTKDFCELIDGIVVFPLQFSNLESVQKMCKEYKDMGKKVILSNNFYEYETVNIQLIEKCLKMFPFDYFFGYESKNPMENLKRAIDNIELGKKYNSTPILSWWGDTTHLACLYLFNKEVGLTFSSQKRQRILSKVAISSKDLWYLGFRNLSELKSNPPKALITGAPITSAFFGVSIRDRMRRPKNLPMNNLTRKIPDGVLGVCIDNIMTIKEAANAR